MKEWIQKCTGKLFRIFSKHTILKLSAVVLVIYLLNMGIRWIPTLQIKYASPPVINQEGLMESSGKIEIGAVDFLVAETDTKKLYLDTVTLNIRVEDKATKKTWDSIHPNGTEDEKSLIKIAYMGEDNTFLYWDSFTYAVKNQTYKIEKINGGVRISLAMQELDSNRINEYMPQKILIEKYENTFLKGLDDKAAEGVITEEDAKKYKTTLSLIYLKDEQKNCYYNKYSTAPPLSAVNQMIQITKILNYTTDQLIEDNADFDIAVTIEEPASFVIPIEVVLEEDDFVARVLTNQIQNDNPYYTLTNIELLPYFGSIGPKEIADGYILVPDGAGALLELNKFDSNFGTYSRGLYNNTYFNDFYYLSSYHEALHMPVFGMTYGKGKESAGGFMGIIEHGDETAFITAALASAKENGGGGNYNKVYSKCDITQYSQVSILGPYDSSGGRFMSSTGMMDINYTVRYKLFSGPVTYFDMAKSYKNYLIERHNLTLNYGEKAKLYLDVTGALTLEERILGIPYDKVLSMTSYKELKEILADLAEIPLVVNYMGVFNEGLNHKVMNKAELTSVNGTKKQLTELMDYAKNSQQELFFQTDFGKVYKEGNGFTVDKHAIYNFNGAPAWVYGYYYPTGAFSSLTNYFNFLNPVYLDSVVDGFLKKAESYNNLYIGDLAVDYFANYKKKEIVTPAEAQAIIDKNLEKLAGTKTLALNNPAINKIPFGRYAANISRESSGYGGIAVEIPFRQLVMNGLISYTTLNINESGASEDYFLLQALELGSYPKFTLTSKSLDLLKNSKYTDFISRQYSLLSNDIKKLYNRYEEAFKQINSMEIKNHDVLQENVFETTYQNGVRVITNYNKYPVVVNEQNIEALGYLIIQ